MILKNKGAEWFVPDDASVENALKRTTHLAIAAHQDDVEIMAYDGILKCFGDNSKWFSAVVVTDGAGSARSGLYSKYTDDEIKVVRKTEQKKAAYIGEYSAVALLNYTSNQARTPDVKDMINELKEIISYAKADIIYTHNLADKHETHVSVAVKVIEAIRELPSEMHPKKLFGCEVWRSLDWLSDENKVSHDVSLRQNLSTALLGVFDSQISGGKRYDLATIGRRIANATFSASHEVDKSSALDLAMDLTPLIENSNLEIAEFIRNYIRNFERDVIEKINRLL